MNVVPLTAIWRKCGRCRSHRGGDRVPLRRAQRNAADWRADLPQLVIETDAFSNRAAFGWIETPAPISLRISACSNTVASRPLARSASAAVRPPIPPPTIAMRSEPGITLRPLLLTAITDHVMLPSGCGLSAGTVGRCTKRNWSGRR